MKKKPTSAKKCKDLRRRRNPGFLDGKAVMHVDDYVKLARAGKLAPHFTPKEVPLPTLPSAASNPYSSAA